MQRTLELPHPCKGEYTAWCQGRTAIAKVQILQDEWRIVIPPCWDYGIAYDSDDVPINSRWARMLLELEKASGYRIIKKEEVVLLAQSRGLSFFDLDIEPIWESCNRRWKYYLLRDVARAAKKPRKKWCDQCGALFNTMRDYEEGEPIRWFEIRNQHDDLIHQFVETCKCLSDEEIDREVRTQREAMFCSFKCGVEWSEKRYRAGMDRKRQLEEMKCLKAQIKAFRKYLKTKDLEVLRSLPPGYGPAKTSQP